MTAAHLDLYARFHRFLRTFATQVNLWFVRRLLYGLLGEACDTHAETIAEMEMSFEMQQEPSSPGTHSHQATAGAAP